MLPSSLRRGGCVAAGVVCSSLRLQQRVGAPDVLLGQVAGRLLQLEAVDDRIVARPGEVAGREKFVRLWKQAMSGLAFVGFFASAGPIRVDGATAHGTWYQQEFLHGKDGVRRAITGQYEDDYVKRGGRWYFQRRVYKILHSQETKG